MRHLLLFMLVLIVATNLNPVQAQSIERDYWPTDDWRTAALAEQGMSDELLQAALAHIDETMPFMNSLLIVRHGDIVLERYFNGFDRDSLQVIWSATKSFTSALIGIALEEGAIESLDTPVARYFPEYISQTDDTGKRDITVHHLLMMRSGLGWVEGPASVLLWRSERDQIAHLLGLEQAYPPGEHWSYSTGDSHLLSAILTRATGQSALDYAREHLFAPLGITNVEWTADSAGYNIGGAELHLSARDMAKFGYLYLNNGMWDGQQIVPAAWVKQTTTPQPGPSGGPSDYSEHWWRLNLDGYVINAALGYAGQAIAIIPELDMVVVMTNDSSSALSAFLRQQAAMVQLMEDFIIPAAEGQ